MTVSELGAWGAGVASWRDLAVQSREAVVAELGSIVAFRRVVALRAECSAELAALEEERERLERALPELERCAAVAGERVQRAVRAVEAHIDREHVARLPVNDARERECSVAAAELADCKSKLLETQRALRVVLGRLEVLQSAAVRLKNVAEPETPHLQALGLLRVEPQVEQRRRR